MELAGIEIVTDGGPWAQHNMPCPVCQDRPAVLDMSMWVFLPCWDCQREDWLLFKPVGWLAHWIGRWMEKKYHDKEYRRVYQ